MRLERPAPALHPVPLAVQYDVLSLEEFWSCFGESFDHRGIVIPGAGPLRLGTEVSLDLRLANGRPLLQGFGRARKIVLDEEGAPGLDIEFLQLDEPSLGRLRYLEQRRIESRHEGVIEECATVIVAMPAPLAIPAQAAAASAPLDEDTLQDTELFFHAHARTENRPVLRVQRFPGWGPLALVGGLMSVTTLIGILIALCF